MRGLREGTLRWILKQVKSLPYLPEEARRLEAKPGWEGQSFLFTLSTLPFLKPFLLFSRY